MSERLDELVLRVDLEDGLLHRDLAAGPHEQLLQVRPHVTLIGDEHAGAVGEAARQPHLFELLLEADPQVGDERAQLLFFLGRGLFLFGRGLALGGLELGRGEVALVDGAQLLARELLQALGDPLIDRLDKQQHIELALAQRLDVRAGLDKLPRGAGDEIDLVLALGHLGQVVAKRDPLVGRGVQAAPQRHLGDLLAVRRVEEQALFDDAAKLVPELAVGLRLLLFDALELLEDLLHQLLLDGADDLILLQDFPRDIERQIIGVNHAAHKAQPRRKQLLGVIEDEHPAHIQLHAAPLVAVHRQIKGRLGRNVEDRLELVGSVKRQVQVGERVALDKAAGELLVEVLVLVGGDFAGPSRPQGGAAVSLLAVQAHRPLYVVTVLLDDRLQPPVLQVLALFIIEVQGDRGADAGAGAGR